MKTVIISGIFFGTFLVLFFAARTRHRAARIALAVLVFIALVIQGGLAALGKQLNAGFSGSGNSTLLWWMAFASLARAIYSIVLMFTRGTTTSA